MSSQQNSSEDYQAREVSKGPKRLLNTTSQGIDPDDPSTWEKFPEMRLVHVEVDVNINIVTVSYNYLNSPSLLFAH